MKKITQQGFTLIEMITVLGIFMVMTSIVLFNYNRFTNDTILTNMAYEVALSVREAQIYGVSVRKPSGDTSAEFNSPYGIHFIDVADGTPSYFLFADTNDNGVYDGGPTCTPGGGECVIPYATQKDIRIVSVLTKAGGGCTEGDLSIVFRRPNPEPVMNDLIDREYAEIALKGPRSDSVRYVIVSNNGQIYVRNTSLCNS